MVRRTVPHWSNRISSSRNRNTSHFTCPRPVEHAKVCAKAAGRSDEYRQGQFDKAEFIQKMIAPNDLTRPVRGHGEDIGHADHHQPLERGLDLVAEEPFPGRLIRPWIQSNHSHLSAVQFHGKP